MKYVALMQIVSRTTDGSVYEPGSVVPTDHLTDAEIQRLLDAGGIKPLDGDATISELEGVKGINAAHAQALADMGITTYAQLADSNTAAVLAGVAGAKVKTVRGWQSEARAKIAG